MGASGFYLKDDKYYDEECYNTLYMPACTKCKKPIIGQHVKAFGGQFHSECLSCKGCNKPICKIS